VKSPRQRGELSARWARRTRALRAAWSRRRRLGVEGFRRPSGIRGM